MPRLPDYNDLGARPAVDVTRPQVAPVDTSLGSALEPTIKAIDEAQRRQDTDAVFQAKRALDQWEMQNIYGEGGAASKLGRDALDLPKTIPSSFDEFVKTVEPTLTTPRAKQAFAEVALSRRSQIGEWAARHANQQRKVYEQGQVEADVSSSVDRAVMLAMAGDSANSAAEVKVGQARMVGYMRSLGRSEEEIAAETGKLSGRVGAALVRSFIDSGRIDDAKQVLARDGAAIPLEQRVPLMKALDEAVTMRQSQDVADQLFSQYQGDVSQALREVRQKYSGKQEDAIVTRLKTLDAERVTLRERAQKDAADQAWRVYESTGSLSKVPPSVLAAMDGRDASALRRAARADAQAAIDRREVKTDPGVYYALSRAAAEDASAFRNEDLRRYFDKLSPGDRKHFIDLQSGLVKGDESARVVSYEQQKSALVMALRLPKDKAGLFYKVADQQVMAAQAAAGRKLSQDETQKILDRLVLQGESDADGFFGGKERMFQSISSGRPFEPRWSDDDVRKATAALQKSGVSKPSKEQIDATLRASYGVK